MKTFLARVAVFGVLALSVSPSTSDAESQVEMKQQAAEAFEKADKKLNEVYRELSAKIDSESLAKLKTAQRAWVEFRDAETDFQGDLAARGGTIMSLIRSIKLKELTEERTKSLQAALESVKTGR
ncbi:MAG: lysozyme inhibitor LprI family protein [Verrucomicrobiota bacterium]